MENEVKDINDFDFEGIKFRLGKKNRNLRLTLPGMKLLSKYYGSVDNAFVQLDSIRKTGMKNFMNEKFLDMIAKFTHACIIHEDEKIKLEQVEKMMDFHVLTPLFVVIQNIIQGSMPKIKNDGESVGELKAEILSK